MGRHVLYSNGKPAIKASKLSYVIVTAKGAKFVRCPEPQCSRLVRVRRNLIEQHEAGEGVHGITDCPRAFQPIDFDITPEQIAELSMGALADAATRRGTRSHLKPRPPVQTALAHMNRDRTPHPEQVAGWSESALSATDLEYANLAMPRRRT